MLLTVCVLCGMLSPGLAEVVAPDVDAPVTDSPDSGDLIDFLDDSQSIDLEYLMTPEESFVVETPVYDEGGSETGDEAFEVSGGTLVKYNGTDSQVTVPDKVNNVAITAIGEGAFEGCTGLTGVTLPDGVLTIGKKAFFGCSAMTDINMPGGLKTIEESAFEGCASLGNVTLPNSLNEIGKSAFKGCATFTDMNIPSSVSVIDSEVMKDCVALKHCAIDNKTIATLPSRFFSGCTALESVKLPEMLMDVSSGAFEDCKALATLALPDEVYSVGDRAFSGCESLTSVVLPSALDSIGLAAFSGCAALTTIDLPGGISQISESAFEGCASLTALTIPEAVTQLGNRAFSGCTGLTALVVPGNVSQIGTEAFKGCTALGSVELPAGLTAIGAGAFDGCSSLAQLSLPAGVTALGDYTFRNCVTLTSLNVPSHVTEIGIGAFSGCTALKAVALPNLSVAGIPEGLFDGCAALTDITCYDDAGKTVAVTDLNGKFVTNTKLPASVTSIDAAAFKGCVSLGELVIPRSVASVADDAFQGCYPGKLIIGPYTDELVAYCNARSIPFDPNLKYWPVTEMTISNTELSLEIQPSPVTATLTATFGPPHATSPYGVWSSSDKSVVAVKNGVVTVTGRTDGEATVTCKAVEDPIDVTCKVRIIRVPTASVTLNRTSLTLYPAGPKDTGATLTYTLATPSGFTSTTPSNPNVMWSSSDKSVATVNDKGEVKAVAPGRAVITCASEDDPVSASCAVTVDPVPVTSVKLTQAPKTVFPGDSFTLTGTVAPEYATYPAVVWTSSDPAVATVTGGTVKAVAPGKVTITCKSELYAPSATCEFTVDPILVNGITLSESAKALTIGSSFTLTVTKLSPDKPTNPKVAWSSSDPAIAKVSNGVVSGVAEGKATITCASVDGGARATCEITVSSTPKPDDPDDPDDPVNPDNPDKPVDPDDPDDPYNPDDPDNPVGPFDPSSDPSIPDYSVNYTTGVSLNITELTLVESDVAQLYADVQPSNSWNRTVTWSSSDAGVVNVSGGALTAVATGTAIITATTFDGKAAAATVNVVKAVAPKKVRMNAPKTVVMGIGEKLALSVTMQPDNARSALTWASSKAAVASVDAGGIVTALKKGTTTISVKTANRKKAKVKIKVVDPYEPTKVSFNLPKTVNVSVGETLALTATLFPATARTTLQWSSSKADVAAVDAEGIVTGLKKGTATVTVMTANRKKARVKIKVIDPNEALSVYVYSPTEVTTLHVGETLQLAASLSPATAVTTLAWTSGKTAVATVDANGVVTALKKGSATITVQTANNKKGKLKITVVD